MRLVSIYKLLLLGVAVDTKSSEPIRVRGAADDVTDSQSTWSFAACRFLCWILNFSTRATQTVGEFDKGASRPK